MLLKYPSPATAVNVEVLTACHEVPPDTVAKDKTPDPSVFKNWSASPSFVGNVKVTFEATVAGACKATYCPPDASCNLKSPWAAIDKLVPSQVRLAEPPNDPELLNCTCVSEPPGNPPRTTSLMSGLVPSLAVAERIFQPLSVVAQVIVSPEPDAYLNWTV